LIVGDQRGLRPVLNVTQPVTRTGLLFLALAVPAGAYAVMWLLLTREPSHTLYLNATRALMAVAIGLVAILSVSWILRLQGDIARSFGGLSPRSALAGIPLFLAWVILYYGTALVTAILFPTFPGTRAFRLVTTAPMAIVLLLAVVAAVFEEMLIVGVAVNALGPRGAAVSVGGSAILRGLCHLHQGPLAAVAAVPVGLVFAAVYWRSRNLWPLVVAHALGSILAFVLAGANSL
jgi:membrane protease YdiL (CAAX protease family)